MKNKITTLDQQLAFYMVNSEGNSISNALSCFDVFRSNFSYPVSFLYQSSQFLIQGHFKKLHSDQFWHALDSTDWSGQGGVEIEWQIDDQTVFYQLIF